LFLSFISTKKAELDNETSRYSDTTETLGHSQQGVGGLYLGVVNTFTTHLHIVGRKWLRITLHMETDLI